MLPELRRVLPRLARGESPFTALSDEVTRFSTHYRTLERNADTAGPLHNP